MKTINDLMCSWKLNKGLINPSNLDCSKCTGYEIKCKCYAPLPDYKPEESKGGLK